MNDYNDIFYDTLTKDIIDVLKEKSRTVQEIKSILDSKSIFYEKQVIYNRLQVILSLSGRAISPAQPEIIRTCMLGGEDIYTYLDYEMGKLSRHYRKIKIIQNPNAILHISDFHYGKWLDEEDIYKNAMIQKAVHQYAIEKGVDVAFVNGDVFEKIKLPKLDEDLDFFGDEYAMLERAYSFLEDESRKEEVYKRWNLLKKIFKYCMPNDDRLQYYSIIGNHDKTLNALSICLSGLDLRQLSLLNPNFYMFPYKDCCFHIGDKNVLLTHEFYLSSLIRDNMESGFFGTVHHVEDLGKKSIKKVLNSGLCAMVVCGHLHDAQLSTYKPDWASDNPIYLITPSTSLYNLNSCVAYITYYHYDSLGNLESVDIEVLKCNEKFEIIPGEIIHHSFKEKQEEYSLVLSDRCNTSTILVDGKKYTIFYHCFINEKQGLQYEIYKNDSNFGLNIHFSHSNLDRNIRSVIVPKISVPLENIKIVFNDLITYNKLSVDFVNLANKIFSNNLDMIRNEIDKNGLIEKIEVDEEGNINIFLNMNSIDKIDIDYDRLYHKIMKWYCTINDVFYHKENDLESFKLNRLIKKI